MIKIALKTHLPVFLIGALLFGPIDVVAQNKAPGNTQKSIVSELSKDALQAKIESINARQGIDEAFKAKILKLYQSAQDHLNDTEGFKTQESTFRQAIKQAPEKIRKLQKEIEQIQPKPDKQYLEDFSAIPTEELEQRLIIEKGKAGALDDQLKKLDNDLTQQGARPQFIRQETLSAQQELEAPQQKQEIQPANSNSALEVEAQRSYLKTFRDAKAAELKMLDAESSSNPVRVELLKIQSQLLNLQKNILTLTINAIETVLAERRQQEARNIEDALSQAEKELAGKHSLIQDITRKNIQYSRDLQTISDRIDYYTGQKNQLDALVNQIGNGNR
jgi:potassium efflux system protein